MSDKEPNDLQYLVASLKDAGVDCRALEARMSTFRVTIDLQAQAIADLQYQIHTACLPTGCDVGGDARSSVRKLAEGYATLKTRNEELQQREAAARTSLALERASKENITNILNDLYKAVHAACASVGCDVPFSSRHSVTRLADLVASRTAESQASHHRAEGLAATVRDLEATIRDTRKALNGRLVSLGLPDAVAALEKAFSDAVSAGDAARWQDRALRAEGELRSIRGSLRNLLDDDAPE